MQNNSRERLRLAQSIQKDASEAFTDISMRPLSGVDDESARSWVKKLVVDHHIQELKLSRFEDDAMTELKIRLLGSSALSNVEASLVETKRIEEKGTTTRTYSVRSDGHTGKSEFSYHSFSTDESKDSHPYQEMPGGAVEELTRVLQQHDVRN